MKPISESYAADDFRLVMAQLKAMARETPGTRVRHVLHNGLRVNVEFDPALDKFAARLASAQGHPSMRDFNALRTGCGAREHTKLLPREFMDNGKIFYEYGFTWFDRLEPLPTRVASNARSAEPSHAPQQKQFA